MTLNADEYRINYEYIKRFMDDKESEERYSYIGPMAVASGVPIIIVCCYYMEMYGKDEKSLAFLDRLMKFYVIDKVLNTRY